MFTVRETSGSPFISPRIMATYTDINYHLVFATKNRLRALHRDRRDDLYRFIWGVLKERKSHL